MCLRYGVFRLLRIAYKTDCSQCSRLVSSSHIYPILLGIIISFCLSTFENKPTCRPSMCLIFAKRQGLMFAHEIYMRKEARPRSSSSSCQRRCSSCRRRHHSSNHCSRYRRQREEARTDSQGANKSPKIKLQNSANVGDTPKPPLIEDF